MQEEEEAGGACGHALAVEALRSPSSVTQTVGQVPLVK
jgi:hypothetical protein